MTTYLSRTQHMPDPSVNHLSLYCVGISGSKISFKDFGLFSSSAHIIGLLVEASLERIDRDIGVFLAW